MPAILALAEEAAAKDKIFILSLSAPFIPLFFKDQLDQTAPYWDYLIGNETEARSYADSHDLGTQDVKKIARVLAELPKENGKRKRIVVITQGTDPTVVAVQGEKEEREYPVHEIEKEKISDTTGAGWGLLAVYIILSIISTTEITNQPPPNSDAFAGGFVAGIVEGKTIDEQVDQGHWLAKLSIQEPGPQYVTSSHSARENREPPSI